MPKLAANLTMLFNEVGFLDRFEAAARAGFRGVEFLFPYVSRRPDRRSPEPLPARPGAAQPARRQLGSR
jgi:predicted alpha/beta-hydrolase family hydrolase